MKIPISFFLILLVTGGAWSQEQMTPDQFKKLVATPGDSKALRKELASLPFWRDAKCSVTLKFQDGRVFKEEMAQSAKTIDGNYVVFSVDSQYYKQPMHAILGYDDKALAIKQWGLFGDTVTEEMMMFDLEKKISASTSTYAGGFREITLGSFSEKEMSGRALAYKNGVLYLTREVKTWPVTNVERDSAATGKSTRSQTNGPSSAAGSGR